MNFLNIHTDLLRSEIYLGAEPLERATWLNLMGWCASQENGGLIRGAAGWNDRKWQQVCGITKEEASLVSELYEFGESGEMIVNHYPKAKEEEVKTNRLNGKKGGRPKGVKPKKNQVVNQGVKPKKTTCPKIAETEGKGREGNGMEEKGEGNGEAPPSLSDLELSGYLPNQCEEIEALVKTINRLRPSFQKSPHLSQLEMNDLSANLAGLQAIDKDDWQVITEFSTSPAGAKEKFIFGTRQRFIAHFSEALQKAHEWSSKKTANGSGETLYGRGAGHGITFS